VSPLSVLPSANPVWRILVPYITSMSMMVTGHSLLYEDKDGASAVWCLLTCLMMMFNGIEIPGIQSRIRTEYLLGEHEN
jgi:hypothetical protein